jgi:hypothetical protein
VKDASDAVFHARGVLIRQAHEAHHPQHLLPERVEMAVDFRFGLDFALSVAIGGWTTTQ